MLKQIVTKVIGTRFDRELKRLQPVVDQIIAIEADLAGYSEEKLKAQTERLRGMLRDRYGELEDLVEEKKKEKHGCADPVQRDALDEEIHGLEEQLSGEIAEALEAILPEAFATVREACRRLVGTTVNVTGHDLTWDMVPYDVQLIGGIVLHQGKIAEMATGEGKTLVATLPLYLNALPGRGAHLVTVNDYLARRDSQWMGHLFSYLGLTVGCIDQTEPHSAERRTAYSSDITYGTNNEFGFDYLRDNMVFSLDHRVQRVHNYAIIDEVDSILIDEARTPLIISGPVGREADTTYRDYNSQVQRLVKRQTDVVNRIIAEAEPLVEGEEPTYEGGVKLHQARMGMPKNKRLMKYMQEAAIQQLVQRVELDAIADRKLPDKEKRLSHLEDDLFFVMDEKGRSVHLTDAGVEVMSPNDPTLFVIPDISEEMGKVDLDDELTAEQKLERRRELEAEYAAKSEKLHVIHKLLQAHVLYENDVEYVVQDGQIFIVDEFTGRIMAGRRWSDGLHQAVEAKEGVTVRGETQTFATITIQNYFRMYEKLSGMTGTAETEETEFFQIYGLEVMVIPTNRPVRRRDHDDVIYRTRREKYQAIIDEVGRNHARGLPVLVGTVTVEASETLSRMLKRSGLKHEVLNAKQHEREAEIVKSAGQPGAVTIATNMAGRGTDIKLGQNVRQCQVCGIKSKLAPFGQQLEEPDLTSAEIKERECQTDPPCGLVIVGTERHESRRIDRQLRGRSGRQGDPGQSQFFLSLEDDLMRLFGSDRIAKWMDRTGADEDEVITHPLVTRAIEKAQKRVELQNFQMRKRLLEFDDVMNQQREVVYSLRLFALEGGEELKAEALRMVLAGLEQFADTYAEDDPDAWDRKVISADLQMRFLLSAPVVEDADVVTDAGDLREQLADLGAQAFQDKLATWESMGEQFNHPDLTERLLSNVMLQVLDEKWKDHLYDLDQLRGAIQFRAYGQNDPLVEYKQEAFDLFADLMHDIRQVFAERLFKLQVQGPGEAPPQAPPRRQVEQSDTDLLVPGAAQTSQPRRDLVASGPGESGPSQRTAKPVQRDAPKVGRNEPCPCGSGKKYKKCHGKT